METTNKNHVSIIWGSIAFIVMMAIHFFVCNLITVLTWKTFALTVTATIATILLANVVWEIFAKERFAQSILKQVKISENIAKSGIDTVYSDFKDIDWKDALSKTHTLTAAFIYAYTWRNNNRTAIQQFISSDSHNKLQIIIPDPENEKIMSDLDRRFGLAKGDIKKRVEDCIKDFLDLKAEVYAFEGTMQASYFLMDQVGIMSFFHHSKAKGSVPALKVASSGHMYEYIKQDLHAMINRSKVIKRIEVNIDNEGNRTVMIEKVV